MEKQKFEKVIACLDRAFYNSNAYKDSIYTAKVLLQAGFAESILDSVFIKNIVNLLAPFVQNAKVKEALRLLQEGLTEYDKAERQAARGTPAKKRLKSDLDEFQIETYASNNETINKSFVASENAWKITDVGGHYIYFDTEDKAIKYRQTLLDKYTLQGKMFKPVLT